MRLRVLVWWMLAMLGCGALVLSPELPWTTTPSIGSAIAINGFNSASYISGSGSLVAQLGSLGSGQQDLASELSSLGGDSSGVIVIPSLNSIPADLGGSDAEARWGIFVLVLGAVALFTAVWLPWGEIDRRRSMARVVAVSAGLALVPLGHELSRAGLTFASSSSDSTGIGIYVGLAGSLVAACAGVFLFLTWRAGGLQR